MSDLSGTSFKAAEVSELYVHRPPYASDIYGCLAEHAPSTRRLLDLGCGEGRIARPLSTVFDQVVAVDPSANMIGLGKSLENGQAAKIDWIEAKAEDAIMDGKFDLVTFASSIHWMDPKLLVAKLRHHVSTDHLLAIVEGDGAFEPPWHADWQAFLSKWVPLVTGRPLGSEEWQTSRDRHQAHMDFVQSHEFVSAPFAQTVESFILCQHSRNTFTLSKLGIRVADFRRELAELLEAHANEDGYLSFRIKTRLTFAKLDLSAR